VAATLDWSPPAFNTIVNHCIRDVLTLEAVTTHLKPYNTVLNGYGSAL
jgi:hypothetical protein